MEIGQILAELRAEKGLYQKELAAVLNVSTGTISNYENNIHAPDLDTLCRIADYFGVTTDFLLRRTKYRHSLDTLNRQLIRDYTVADMVNTTLELSPRDISSMMDFLVLLKRRSMSESSG